MLERRTFLVMISGGLLAAPLAAEGQQGAKVPRVGALWIGSATTPTVSAFDEALRDLGWVEGQNIVIERRYAEWSYERLPGLAAELVRLRVDVILAGGGPPSLNAARDATKTIPIVMVASSSDPVGQGLIKSFARPGGNITGLVTAPEGLGGKRLELLKEAIPGLSRVGVLWDASITRSAVSRVWKLTEEAARLLGVEVLVFEVHEPTDLDSAVKAATKARVGGLAVFGTPMFVRHRGEIADLLTKHRLPAISEWRDFPEAGLLMSYGASRPAQFRRAAVYVDKILKGAKPGDLPVEQPTKFELVINMKTAKALGLTIPPSLLLRADQVIE